MALLKKYLFPLTQPVLHLLADGIDPRELVKPVLLEVENLPDPREFILRTPRNPNLPQDLSDEATEAAHTLQSIGQDVHMVRQPVREGKIICDELWFKGAGDFEGVLTVWRKDSEHRVNQLSCWLRSWRGVSLLSEHTPNIDYLVRLVKFATQVLVPRIASDPPKVGKRKAEQMLAKFKRLAQEAMDPREFLLSQDPAGVIGWVARTTAKYYDAKDAPYLAGRYFPYNADRGGSFTKMLGDARVYRRKSTWLRGWPDNFQRGYWELVPVFHDPRRYGDRALEPQEPRKFFFKPPPPEPDDVAESAGLAWSLICESPKFKTLKAQRRTLSPEEKAQAKDAPVWKAEVNGTTWYVSNTHRCFQAHKSISAAIKAYWEVVEPSG